MLGKLIAASKTQNAVNCSSLIVSPPESHHPEGNARRSGLVCVLSRNREDWIGAVLIWSTILAFGVKKVRNVVGVVFSAGNVRPSPSDKLDRLAV